MNDNIGDGILLTEGATTNYIVNNTMMRNGGPLWGTVFFHAAGRVRSGRPPAVSRSTEWNQNNRCLTQTTRFPGTCGPDEEGS